MIIEECATSKFVLWCSFPLSSDIITNYILPSFIAFQSLQAKREGERERETILLMVQSLTLSLAQLRVSRFVRHHFIKDLYDQCTKKVNERKMSRQSCPPFFVPPEMRTPFSPLGHTTPHHTTTTTTTKG